MQRRQLQPTCSQAPWSKDVEVTREMLKLDIDGFAQLEFGLELDQLNPNTLWRALESFIGPVVCGSLRDSGIATPT
jgi:hypothetical protein